MPDENDFFTDAEKATYRGEPCEICGTPKEPLTWYPRRSLADQSNSAGLWSKAGVDVCPRQRAHQQ